jgi:hypothetical protein
MRNRVLLFLVVILATSCATKSGEAIYLGSKNGGELVQRDGYHLTLPVPSGAFKNSNWSLFEKYKDQDFVANIGLGNSYSWAFGVTIKNTREKSIEAIASQQYRNGKFTSVTTKENNSCVKGDLEGIETTGIRRFYILSLYCLNITSKKSFVVSISEINLLSREPDEHFLKAANDLFSDFEIE